MKAELEDDKKEEPKIVEVSEEEYKKAVHTDNKKDKKAKKTN